MIYFCSQYVLLLLIESASLLHSDGSTNKTKMLDDPVTAEPVDIGGRAVRSPPTPPRDFGTFKTRLFDFLVASERLGYPTNDGTTKKILWQNFTWLLLLIFFKKTPKALKNFSWWCYCLFFNTLNRRRKNISFSKPVTAIFAEK